MSIIIRTVKGRESYLSQTIESLLHQTFENFEIIIVAQGYTGDELRFLCNNRIKSFYVQEKNQVSARNLGIRNSNAEILAFVDDDIITPQDWLHKIVSCYDLPNVGGVGGPIITPTKRVPPSMERIAWMCLLNPVPFHVSRLGIITTSMSCSQRRAKLLSVDTLVGANMSFHRNVIKKVGLFDENYLTYGAKEETDYCLRVVRHGYLLVMNSDAPVIHLRAPNPKRTTAHRPRIRGLTENKSWYATYAKNDIYFFMKFFDPSFLDWFRFLTVRIIEVLIHLVFLSRNLAPLWQMFGYPGGHQRAKAVLRG